MLSKRAARLGDGWMPNYRTPQEAASALSLLRHTLEENNRNPNSFGIEPRLSYGKGDPARWETWIKDWQTAGATHASINTMGLGFTKPQEHIQAIEKFAKWLKS